MTEVGAAGLVGLGVMGRALAENVLRNDFDLVVWDVDESAAQTAAALSDRCTPATSLKDLTSRLTAPRTVLVIVPAGKAVDATVTALADVLEPGDVIVDLGNSNFEDTDRRYEALQRRNISFVGSGISGGEEGARVGPALMPGGDSDAWPVVRPLLQAISARYHGEPCCEWVGSGGAGHYVKMVHNGIEYGDMQVIAEAYDLMHRGLNMDHQSMGDTFETFNAGSLQSYLIEIAADVLRAKDSDGEPLIEKVLDAAGQKGTGKWTAISGLTLGAPVTLIAEAVYARCVSAQVEHRQALGGIYSGEACLDIDDAAAFINDLADAMFVARVVSYTQGFMLMDAASKDYGWGLEPGNIARLWRGGCIIRSALLEPIANAFDSDTRPDSLLGDPWFAREVERRLPALRRVVSACVIGGIAVPCLANAIGFVDSMRAGRGSANMIQALRDCFGAHTYERVDRPRGEYFHSVWTTAAD